MSEEVFLPPVRFPLKMREKQKAMIDQVSQAQEDKGWSTQVQRVIEAMTTGTGEDRGCHRRGVRKIYVDPATR